MSKSVSGRMFEQKGLLLLALVAAFGFSAVVTTAVGAHFHDYACNGNCSTGHGMVHGSSTTDNAFHSRVDSRPPNPGGFWAQCVLRRYPDQNVYIVGEKTSYGDLCNAFTNGGWYEQASIAKVHSYDCGGCSGSRIDEHGHLAH